MSNQTTQDSPQLLRKMNLLDSNFLIIGAIVGSGIFMAIGPNLGTVLSTTSFLEGSRITQVVENKVVGDTGFEPVTSTVCRLDGKRKKPKK